MNQTLVSNFAEKTATLNGGDLRGT
jgi:hypothetical protein